MRDLLVSAGVIAVLAAAGATAVFGEQAVVDDSREPASVLSEDEGGTDLVTGGFVVPEYGVSVFSDWSVALGAVFLRRNDPEPRALIVDPQSGSPLMGTSDLKPGWGSGPRIELTKWLNRGRELEIEWFGIDNWSNRAEAHNGSPAVGESFWAPFVFDDVQAAYGTDLYSLECNLRWPLFGSRFATGLAGFRWAELKERFSTDVSAQQGGNTFTNSGTLDLDNHLYGFQLGAESVLWDPASPFRVEGFLKAGVYGNHVDWLLATSGDLDNRQWERHASRASFIGEVALKLSYDVVVGPGWCWSVFGEYEALWLADVATAEQLKDMIVYDTAFYHGVFIGLEIPLGRDAYGGY